MHERISVNSLCFPGVDLGTVVRCWQELDARRVGLISALLDDEEAVASVVEDGGYTVETIWHPFLSGHLDTGVAALMEGQADLSRVIDAAARLGARSVYLTTGGHGSLTWEAAAARFGAAIGPGARQAEESGVALLIENAPALRADLHIAHSLHDTVLLAESADLGVCVDIAGCWTEAGLSLSIERATPRCRLVQVSDYVFGDRGTPNRAVPGDGDIPLERIIGWTLAAGYTGNFDLELIGPRIDAEGHLAATGRAATVLSEILESLGA